MPVSWRSALTTVFVERRLPWRLEQWLNRRATVQALRERRLARLDRDLYRPYIRPGDLVFDVGANRGDKAAVFVALGARVLAIEPDAQTAAALRRRFDHESRVQVLAAGIGATTGEMLFHPSPHPTRSTFTVDRMRRLGDGEHMSWGPGVRVPVSTLDALIAAHGIPRFCKIDVEGYEPEVFRGLSRPLPSLSFEFHGELLDDAEECIEMLARLGMTRFNVVLHPSGTLRHQKLNRLYFPTHVSGTDLVTTLQSIAASHSVAGDIWAFSDG
jgi:FkbM family methyltransferase